MAESTMSVSLYEEEESYSYYEGRVTLSAWRGFASSQHPEFPLVIGEDMSGEVDTDEPAITNEHIAAYQYLVDHQERIRDLILAQALDVYMASRADSGCYGEELARNLPAISDPLALSQLMKLGRVHILNVARDGYAYIGLECDACAWDVEHGLGFVLHKDEIIHTGHAADAGRAHIAMEDKERYE